LAEKQLIATNANIGVGKLPESAAFEVQTIMLNRRAIAATARQAVVDRSLALRNLLALAIEPGALSAATPPSDAEPSSGPSSVNDVLSAVEQSNPTLRAALVKTELAQFEARVTKNELLPQLDVTVSAGPVGAATRRALPTRSCSAFGATPSPRICCSRSRSRTAKRSAASPLPSPRTTKAKCSSPMRAPRCNRPHAARCLNTATRPSVPAWRAKRWQIARGDVEASKHASPPGAAATGRCCAAKTGWRKRSSSWRAPRSTGYKQRCSFAR